MSEHQNNKKLQEIVQNFEQRVVRPKLGTISIDELN